ncbi:MAG: hypothetical protein CMN91_05985, partial [Synechococcus sp. ARS1019]|nr:hypothetical protein [Synechococcus sp. ARS1019]
MAVIRGRYISLAESLERRSRLEQHLQELGVQERYSWFPAVHGDTETAAARGLRPGEWGLWQSWLQLLKEELTHTQSSYDWLHIVEDDAELSGHFLAFCDHLREGQPTFDLLFTDMYVNPSIHRSFAEEHQRLETLGQIQLKTDLYTGCTSSVLIHRQRIPLVLSRLQECLSGSRSLLPLDNQLLRLFHDKQLNFARTAPFITGVQRNSISESTIQQRNQDHRSVVVTQQICANLRRQLSVLETSNPTNELIHLMHTLAKDYSQPSQEDLTRRISLELMHLAEQQN